MSIRSAIYSDIVEVARVHKDQFKDHFLGQYSIEMIGKFYLPFLGSNIFLVSDSGGTINGFVMGGYATKLNRSRQKFLSDNKLRYVTETLLKPSIYIQALKRIKVFKKINKPADLDEKKDPVRLLSIAVSDKAKGSGIANELLSEFEKYVDSESYGLSVKNSNKRAIKFYSKNGFEMVEEKAESLGFEKKLK